MNLLPVIEAKRDGRELDPGQIREFVADYVAGRIPDYQTAAFLMAVCCRGMTTRETTALTLSMRDSGETLKFPADSRLLVDKHSTGGVGDKVSLPLAPLLACLGFRVPMISGRGLGITGGTLDKLESIPGFTTALDQPRIREIVQSVGCVICAQTERMVPADKGLYALRDATGAVPSIPLITASILSKKLAENLDALVLDVKFGSGAFMKTFDQARALALAMVELGGACGVNTRALITNMDRPLGRAAGNWLEVKEAVECLEGGGPADLRQLVLELAAQLLEQTGRITNHEEARARAEACLDSGQPRQKWDALLAAQGADLEAFNTKLKSDAAAPVIRELAADRDGFLSSCNSRLIGEVARDLGAGRLTRDTVINHDVGIDRLAARGEVVTKGSILCRVHASGSAMAEAALARLGPAFVLSAIAPNPPPLVAQVL